MLPDFNRLKVFYHIFKHQSVVQAARELHVTQSAVSQALNKLEEEIQQSLFTRVHKKLVPTPAGIRLFESMEPFIANLKIQLELIRHSLSAPSGLLRIGAPVEFGEKYLVPACAGFREIYPRVSFQLEFGHPDKLIPVIKKGDLDFALADIFNRQGEYSRDRAILDIQPIFIEELVLACSQKYYDRQLKGRQQFKTLTESDYITYQLHAPAIKDWFRHHYKKTSSQLKTSLTVESVRGVVSGIRQHLGLGIVPSHLINREIEQGGMVVIRTSARELINQISLVRLLDKVPNLTEKEFITFFHDFIENVRK
ncbi:MAG: LysR family transcriptional regulator [Proteobacteria bacterium]|nr:LysR family transcriptional regulator [Pseudomonadota bacterium]